MTAKVAINGFGRIGRNVLRALAEHGRDDIEVVAINDLAPPATNAHLFRYDSVHGRFPGEAKLEGDTLHIRTAAGKSLAPIKVLAERDLAKLPWGELGVDIVLECTGIFTSREKASGPSRRRRQAGAGLGPGRRRRPHRRLRRQPGPAARPAHRGQQRVLHHQLPGPGRQGAQRPGRHRAWPHDHDPRLHQRPEPARRLPQGPLPGARRDRLDDPDLDRCRQGRGPRPARAEGQARRRGDPRADAERHRWSTSPSCPSATPSAEEINAALKARGAGPAQGHSRGSPRSRWSRSTSTTTQHSSTVDLKATKVIEGKLVRVASWYDNEWGFSNRMCDTAALMAKL